MKQLFAILLAIALLTTLPMTAFAASDDGTHGSQSIIMTGRYDNSDAIPDVVSVDVAWGAMDFNYTSEGVEWDPQKHQNVTKDAGWTSDGNDITVTNHSNISVTASLGFTTDAGVTGKFYDAEENGTAVTDVTLDRAENGSASDSQKQTVWFVIESGEITADVEKLGSITLTIKGNGKKAVSFAMAENAKTEYTYGVYASLDLSTLVTNNAGLGMSYELVSGPECSINGSNLTFGDCGTYTVQVTTAETDDYKAGKYVFTITLVPQTDWDGDEIPIS